MITLLTFLFLVDATKCHGVEQGLMVVFGTTVVLFLAGVSVVGIRVWTATPPVAERLVVVVGYGVALLASFVVFAFGLMVAFNHTNDFPQVIVARSSADGRPVQSSGRRLLPVQVRESRIAPTGKRFCA